ncbi:hypothetical protein GRF59_15000 [Paenibacillus sp. HJL G12]|uniref:Uncharacterized protein n=1 Tax=Paenibacillus dendrobii TaxID=2691084 RepID=A0A7X3IJ42_9BACL|nr:hypothetical protein [Paenibacillus dendrobii]MWV44928.1 hypothetical protein [Paenibacillus dendrobii]
MILFGIHVLESDWIDVTEESTQYNEVKFKFDSLTKYYGTSVEILHDWKMKIWDDQGSIIDEFYLIENDEFREELYTKFPLK